MVGDTLAESGSNFASDDDPELVAAAIPFGLKTIEGLLVESPRHKGLLFAACSGFTQYCTRSSSRRPTTSRRRTCRRPRPMRARAKKLYLRAVGYGMRDFDVEIPGFSELVRKDPDAALAKTTKKHVPLLYYTGGGLGGSVRHRRDRLGAVGPPDGDREDDAPRARARRRAGSWARCTTSSSRGRRATPRPAGRWTRRASTTPAAEAAVGRHAGVAAACPSPSRCCVSRTEEEGVRGAAERGAGRSTSPGAARAEAGQRHRQRRASGSSRGSTSCSVAFVETLIMIRRRSLLPLRPRPRPRGRVCVVPAAGARHPSPSRWPRSCRPTRPGSSC